MSALFVLPVLFFSPWKLCSHTFPVSIQNIAVVSKTPKDESLGHFTTGETIVCKPTCREDCFWCLPGLKWEKRVSGTDMI